MKLTALIFALGAFAACSSDNGGSGGDDGQADAGPGSATRCGDGVCSASEVTSCSADCGDAPYCGDTICNNGETTTSCANDCGGGGSGSGSGSGGGGGTCPTPAPQITDCIGCLTGACPGGLADINACITCAAGGGGGSGGFGDIGCDNMAADGICSQDEMDGGGSAACSDCP